MKTGTILIVGGVGLAALLFGDKLGLFGGAEGGGGSKKATVTSGVAGITPQEVQTIYVPQPYGVPIPFFEPTPQPTPQPTQTTTQNPNYLYGVPTVPGLNVPITGVPVNSPLRAAISSTSLSQTGVSLKKDMATNPITTPDLRTALAQATSGGSSGSNTKKSSSSPSYGTTQYSGGSSVIAAAIKAQGSTRYYI